MVDMNIDEIFTGLIKEINANANESKSQKERTEYLSILNDLRKVYDKIKDVKNGYK